MNNFNFDVQLINLALNFPETMRQGFTSLYKSKSNNEMQHI